MPMMPPQQTSIPRSRTSCERLPALLPRVRRDDLREVRAGGLEVVVVAVDAHRLQLVGLLAGEDAERAGDVDVDGARGSPSMPSRTCAISRSSGPRTAATMQNSVAPGRRRLARRLDERRDVEPRGAHRRLEAPGLRAEVAVLRAAAGLQAHDALDLDVGPAPAHAHLVGERERVVDALVGQAQHLAASAPRRGPSPRSSTCSRAMSRMSVISVLRRDPSSARRRRRRLQLGAPSGTRPRTGRRCTRAGPRRLQRCGEVRVRGPRADRRRRGSAGRARASASQVSAAWLSVPRPARATTSTRRVEQRRATSASVAAVLVEAHEQAAGALDEHEVAVVAGRATAAAIASADAPGSPARARGGGGRQRLGVARELVDVLDAAQPPHLVEVAGLAGADAGLRGLDHRDARAARPRAGGQRGRDDRLAHAGVGPGDDQRRSSRGPGRRGGHHRRGDPREVLVVGDVGRHRVDQVAERAQPHAALDRRRACAAATSTGPSSSITPIAPSTRTSATPGQLARRRQAGAQAALDARHLVAPRAARRAARSRPARPRTPAGWPCRSGRA